MAKRLIEFLRSVVPADPYQLLYLSGVICLVSAHGLKWWTNTMRMAPDRLASPFGRTVAEVGVAFLLPIVFATITGYYICFWPGNRPIRRIFGFVIVPTVSAVVLTLLRFLYLAGPSSSILQGSGVSAVEKIKWLQSIFLGSIGLQVALVGLLLIVLFVARIWLGVSSLPLRLAGICSQDSNDSIGWKRVPGLIWFFIAVSPFVVSATAVTAVLLFDSWFQSKFFSSAVLNLAEVIIYVIAILIVGADGRKTVRRTVSKPGMKWVVLSIVLPVAVEAAIAAGQYALDYLRSTLPDTETAGLHENPLPALLGLIVVYLVPAIVEEVFFRGFLQTRFIHRYGVYRGIFLVGVAWSASHFYGDFSTSHSSYIQIFALLGGRAFMCLSLGFVLSWLTLQSRSIIPATILHTLSNALTNSSPDFVFVGMNFAKIALWGLLAYTLFRYWPSPVAPSPEALSPLEDTPKAGDDSSPITA